MMISNTDLREIGEKLQAADSVLLFPHIHPDGDALGSGVALCRILRSLGKDARILLEDELAYHLAWLDDGCCTTDREIMTDPDICIAIDCSEEKRFPGRASAFERGKSRMAIDHHRVNGCDIDYYYIDSDAASTTEIIYELAKAMDWPLDSKTAEALYTGMVTDTGSFKHSNTRPKTHRIAADLIEAGADVNNVTVRIFKSADPRELAVKADVLGRLEIFANKQAAMSSLDQEQLRSLGAKMEHAESVIDSLAEIRGVEIASILKEDKEGIRVSFRSKTCADVAAIAEGFGGGGHIRASGCTLKMPMDDAYQVVHRAIEEALSEGQAE